MTKLSKRAKLRRLVILYPEWTYSQFAEALEQSRDSVRGAFNAMKLPKPPPESSRLVRKWDGTFVRKSELWKQPENM